MTTREELREAVFEAKGKGCKKCGGKRGLHFHHRDPKTKSWGISTMISDKRSIASLKTEMGKCDLLCPICHRDKHKEMAAS